MPWMMIVRRNRPRCGESIWNNASIAIIVKGIVHRSSRCSTVTFFFSGNSRRSKPEYTLFDLDGIPLRAELKVTLTGYCSQKEENKRFPKRSPDVSRMVTLKEGQTLAALCNEVYGDPLLVGEVARFNNLNGYRNVPSGTKILLPMLKK